MKKHILYFYSIIIFIISLLVMMSNISYGVDTIYEPCEHPTYEYGFNKISHWQQCKDCEYIDETTMEKHLENITEWFAHKNGETHTGTCTKCGYVVTENHIYENGVCTKCEYAQPVEECQHDYEENFDDVYHWQVCELCGDETEKQEHDVETWIDRGDGTHCGMCVNPKCYHSIFESHIFENGVCIKCEAKQQTDVDTGEENGNTEGDNTEGDNTEDENTEGDNGEGNNAQEDNTQADKPIPQTGQNDILIFVGIIAVAIIGGVTLYKSKIK